MIRPPKGCGHGSCSQERAGTNWASADQLRELRSVVARHDVRWEVWPHNHVPSNGEMMRVGFDLEIFGIHYEPHHVPRPGCKECVDVYSSLKRIATAVMPPASCESLYEVSDFDRSLHYQEKLDMRAEVRLTVTILHKVDFERPIDACETGCLHTMETRLGVLGARKGQGRP